MAFQPSARVTKDLEKFHTEIVLWCSHAKRWRLGTPLVGAFDF